MTHNRWVRTRSAHNIPFELGAHLRGNTLEVGVVASHAERVELCLLDPVATDGEQYHERRLEMVGPSNGVWSLSVPDVAAGQRYGFRVHGRWDPQAGLMYNPNKLLLDPYARGITGELVQDPAIFGYLSTGTEPADPYGPADSRDSASFVPHSVVLAPGEASLAAGGSRPSPVRLAPEQVIIYEAHVVGLTKRLCTVPEELRGTYAGIGHPETLRHLRDLGVTTLQLLPIHAFVTEQHLRQLGLTNYWGYNTLGFFAPHAPYATQAAQQAGPQAVLDEVKAMVDAVHEAGLELVLDVVYNHTCEEGLGGPHLSWRGLDNTAYYLHDGSFPARLANVTGTGNALDFRRPQVIKMVLDSLRYWVQEVGVDGFRFDLAVTLGRGTDGFAPDHGLWSAITSDPILAKTRLIAEPWDVGPGGWQTGGFPEPVSEWNDKFRDATRKFWLADAAAISYGGHGQSVAELATRLAGSADVFGHTDPPLRRGQVASVNFVTSHDGFTLTDLVTYSRKHNGANGEQNRDGSDNNNSWNHGLEGPVLHDSIGAEIAPLRRRSIRNLMATLLLSGGMPMLCAGDELGRTQRGNNNAYCQDNEISWLNWDLSPWRQDLLETTRALLSIRREHAALRYPGYALGSPFHSETQLPDLSWYGPDGPLTQDSWNDPENRSLQMLRSGPSPQDPAVLVVMHGGLEPVQLKLPEQGAQVWHLLWDSTWERPDAATALVSEEELHVAAGAQITVDELTIQVYRASH